MPYYIERDPPLEVPDTPPVQKPTPEKARYTKTFLVLSAFAALTVSVANVRADDNIGGKKTIDGEVNSNIAVNTPDMLGGNPVVGTATGTMVDSSTGIGQPASMRNGNFPVDKEVKTIKKDVKKEVKTKEEKLKKEKEKAVKKGDAATQADIDAELKVKRPDVKVW